MYAQLTSYKHILMSQELAILDMTRPDPKHDLQREKTESGTT